VDSSSGDGLPSSTSKSSIGMTPSRRASSSNEPALIWPYRDDEMFCALLSTSSGYHSALSIAVCTTIIFQGQEFRGLFLGSRADFQANPMQYDEHMLRYHVAFHLPRATGEMVVAEALDFPGAVTQGFDLSDARLMIASAMEDLAQILLEEGKPLPIPNPDANADADLIELVPLSVHVGLHGLEEA
jgi:predicted RNase H-like HicB family nuclease